MKSAPKALAPARIFLIALFISHIQRERAYPRTLSHTGTGIPAHAAAFKPYSLSDRKKGAPETVRHFCARSGPLRACAKSRFSNPRHLIASSFSCHAWTTVAIRANLTMNVVETRQFFGPPHRPVLFVAKVTV